MRAYRERGIDDCEFSLEITANFRWETTDPGNEVEAHVTGYYVPGIRRG